MPPQNANLIKPLVSPWMRPVLVSVFALFTMLTVDGGYLCAVRLAEYCSGEMVQNYFYQYVFLAHLVLGGAIILPTVVFLSSHWLRARHHRNRRAVRLGMALLCAVTVLIISGILLTRLEGLIDIRHPFTRSASYWAHLLSVPAVTALYAMHRRAGRTVKWGVRRRYAVAGAGLALAMLALHLQDPRQWTSVAPESGAKYFEPSLARTASGDFIPARNLMNDQYCIDCHAETHERWQYSAHHFSSFNNPAYLASVRETRHDLAARDGHAGGSRFCAGCHDPAPFFSGAFDDPKFDDPDYNLAQDPMAQAGITCTACHAITAINSPRGNADYTIDSPLHYPFAFSNNSALRWINHTLIRANPRFHKQTFLKPLHKTAEFCGTCHKVHLPEELNDYRFLRGQNHYDSFLLSGVSGHGVASFYYPPKAESNCNDCHMPLHDSQDFGAALFDTSGKLKTHDHLFPAANTALPALLDFPDWVPQQHEAFNQNVMRVDLFGAKQGGHIQGRLFAPLGPQTPTLQAGQDYLLETVIRTLKMGHHFTQGTADSNQVWLDVTATQGGQIIGRSGGMDASRSVDPWSHFVNAFVLDADGYRIDRRNAEDIFIALYDHQIPPGAGQVVHYRLRPPANSLEPITVEVKLQYRKFDTHYLRYFSGDSQAVNNLPIMTLAEDRQTFAISGGPAPVAAAQDDFPLWQRWNDYGIGLLLEGTSGANRGELRQAEEAFRQVQLLGRPDGPLNRARVYLAEGRLDDARLALADASQFTPPPPIWTQLWLTGITNQQNGALDEAISNFRTILTLDTAETRARNFDFNLDYRLLNELGRTLLERAKQERGPRRREARDALLRASAERYQQTLVIDPENIAAHYNRSLILNLLGEAENAALHRKLHAKYKLDDNARDRAIVMARSRYPAADHAANSIVIWDLHRKEAYELPPFLDRGRQPSEASE